MTSLTQDLNDLDTTAACDAGAEIELVHPVTRTPLGIFWSILGRDSTVFKDKIRQTVNEDLRKSAANKKRNRPDEVMTVERGEERALDLLATCSTGWRTGDEPHLVFQGEKLPFSYGNAKKVLGSLTWIKDQVDEGMADLENFMKI